MKTITNAIIALFAGAFLMAVTAPAFAAEAKTMTITGTGKCAKCDLKETAACQNVISVDKKGKTVNYYVVDNDISKDFHKNVCKENKKVKATGTVVKDADGKMEFTATKLEVVDK
jgi:Family of unknown function (DUF6370)